MVDKFTVLRNAEKLVANRQYGKAVAEYRKILKSEGEDPTLLNTLGDLLLRSNSRDEALSCFQRVGNLYAQSGFHAKAIGVFKKVLELNPEDDSVVGKLLDLYSARGLSHEAAAFAASQVKRLTEAGNLTKALKLQARAVDLAPSDPKSLCTLGEIQKLNGFLVEAAASFLAAAKLHMGRSDEGSAQNCLETALRINQNSQEAATLLNRLKRPSQPVKAPPAVADVAPRRTETPVEDTDFGRTIEFLDFSKSNEPQAAAPQKSEADGGPFELDYSYSTDRDSKSSPVARATPDEAAAAGVDETISEPTQSSDLEALEERLQEADFYVKLDLMQDARQLISGLLQEFPQEPRVLSRAQELGLAPVGGAGAEADGPGEEFESEVEFALESLFDEAVAEAGGDEDHALTYDVAAAESEEEKTSRAKYDLGLAYREMGMWKDAADRFEEAYRLAVAAGETEQAVLTASMLASTYMQLTEYREVIRWADAGLELGNLKAVEKKSLSYDRSRALEMLGDFKESLRGYRRIFELDPDFRDVQARIARLDLLSG